MCVCTGGEALSMQRWFRLHPPKGQALHRLLCQQVSNDPDVFRDAFGARYGPWNLCSGQNTFMLGKGRRLLCCGGEQSLQEVLYNSPRIFLAAPSTAPLQPTAHLHAGPQQDKPHFYVFLELSSYETHLDFGRGHGLPGGLEQGNNPIKA